MSNEIGGRQARRITLLLLGIILILFAIGLILYLNFSGPTSHKGSGTNINKRLDNLILKMDDLCREISTHTYDTGEEYNVTNVDNHVQPTKPNYSFSLNDNESIISPHERVDVDYDTYKTYKDIPGSISEYPSLIPENKYKTLPEMGENKLQLPAQVDVELHKNRPNFEDRDSNKTFARDPIKERASYNNETSHRIQNSSSYEKENTQPTKDRNGKVKPMTDNTQGLENIERNQSTVLNRDNINNNNGIPSNHEIPLTKPLDKNLIFNTQEYEAQQIALFIFSTDNSLKVIILKYKNKINHTISKTIEEKVSKLINELTEKSNNTKVESLNALDDMENELNTLKTLAIRLDKMRDVLAVNIASYDIFFERVKRYYYDTCYKYMYYIENLTGAIKKYGNNKNTTIITDLDIPEISNLEVEIELNYKLHQYTVDHLKETQDLYEAFKNLYLEKSMRMDTTTYEKANVLRLEFNRHITELLEQEFLLKRVLLISIELKEYVKIWEVCKYVNTRGY